MNSLLKKRLPGILAAGLVTLAVGAAGVTPAAAAEVTTSTATINTANTSSATTSALTRAQRNARARALRNCRKRRNVRQRRVCIRNVNQRFARLARQNRQKPKPGQTWRVDVLDPYSYSPNEMNIKVNDFILWDWRFAGGREPHDVTPSTKWPAGVNRNDFKSPLVTGPNYTFRRQFTQPGAYSFVCSIHFQMTMDVNVSR